MNFFIYILKNLQLYCKLNSTNLPPKVRFCHETSNGSICCKPSASDSVVSLARSDLGELKIPSNLNCRDDDNDDDDDDDDDRC
jgi:hypothetical protein